MELSIMIDNQCRVCNSYASKSTGLYLHKNQNKESKDELTYLMKCDDCGRSWIVETNHPIVENRVLALQWWNAIKDTPLQKKLIVEYFGGFPETGRVIEKVWDIHVQLKVDKKY